MEQDFLTKAQTWLQPPFDTQTQAEVQRLIDHDPKTLEDAFYRNLEFGTGGMRGIMGPGTNRMNVYTLGMAAQGFANYLLKTFPGEKIRVALAHDCRHNSRTFALHCAAVFSANGLEVMLFDDIAPTPALSFAVRHHGCKGGAVITASHNPPEYNGFKVYWEDGAQVVAPHDQNIMNEVAAIISPTQVRIDADMQLVKEIGAETDAAYLDRVARLQLAADEDLDKQSLIVYTALHGTGGRLIPRLLGQMGYRVQTVIEQDRPDGNFSTVESPNPEEKAALDMALTLANKLGAELVMGTDPDADRVGIAIRDHQGKMALLNGNQTGALLVHYYLTRMEEADLLTGRQFVCKTIVTSPLLDDICTWFDVNCYDTLTGFKYIADVIRKKEGKEQYLLGGEESYGYLIGDFVRDKDAVSAAMMIAEMNAWAKKHGMTLYDLLLDVYVRYGLRLERLISLTKKGKDGVEEISRMMTAMRQNPPQSLGGSSVVRIRDIKTGIETDLRTGVTTRLGLPSSNVLQFVTEDEAWLTARPSGTEPKIKFYFSVKGEMESASDFGGVSAELERLMDKIAADLGL